MVKINIKNREFSQMGGGGGASNFGSVSLIFIFKHGLNHPEMQRNLHGHFIKQNQDEDN